MMREERVDDYGEMTNDEYKNEIIAITNNLLNNIGENYSLRYWFLYLREKEKIFTNSD